MVENKQSVGEKVIWEELARINDPEIPVISLVEMKVIRSVRIQEDGVVVIQIAPTFVGCPALEMIRNEIRSRVSTLGCENVTIELSFEPPWSTDLLDDDVKEKLRVFGIAPPPKNGEDLVAVLELPVACPLCGSQQTRLESPFGATLCKQLFFCGSCLQSFERFKPI